MSAASRGDIWLVRFPFSDLSTSKVRPALVVTTHGRDAIVVGIFSRVPTGPIHRTWVLISDSHPEFARTGLKVTSLLRAERIAVVNETVLHRRLGSLPADLFTRVQIALKEALQLP